jgi:hypothetical protein
MSNILYRPAVPADALCLGVLATQVFLDTCATQGIRPALAREVLAHCSVDACAALLADAGVTILVAEHELHLVGFAQIAHGVAHAVQALDDAGRTRAPTVRKASTSSISNGSDRSRA